MRTGKWLGVVVGGAVALFILALGAVWVLVDPTVYKDRIVAAVKQASGRDLRLTGDIKLSLFPWVALELGPASLGNPPGFGAQPFVSFQHATVRAKLLPLLQKRLEVARLEIDGLDVRLQTNAAGRGNWQTPESHAGRGTPPSTQPSGAAGHPGEDTPAAWGLNDIRLKRARVSYENFVVQALNLETGRVTEGVMPIVLHFEVSRGIAPQHASVDAKLDVGADPAREHFRVAALTVIGQVTLADATRPVRWNLSLPALEVNLEGQTVSAPAIALTVSGAQLTGNVQATHIKTDPAVSGSLTLAPLVLREFFPRLGWSQPKTQNGRAFAQLSGSSAFSYAESIARLDHLQLALDDTHLEGTAALDTKDTPTLEFAMSADQLDLDRYLPPDEPAPPPDPVAKPPETPASSAARRPFKANGTLSLGSLHLSRLDLTHLHLTLAADDGVVRIFPLQAQVDGGRYAGDIILDDSATVPTLSVDEHLSGVDMGRLLATNGRKVHLSGTGDFSVQARGTGASSEMLLRTLTGHVEARVIDGAVEGVDLGYDLNRAELLIDPGATPAVADSGRTRFDVFTSSADITDGIARTADLTISSSVLHVSGQGSIDLSTKVIDFALLAAAISSGGTAIQVPVKVTGTTADPTVRPDVAVLAKGPLGQKLKEVLHDKLKGLFGKP